MKNLNIVIAISSVRMTMNRLDDTLVQKIRDVDPSIKITEASELVVKDFRGDIEAREKLDKLLAEADVLVGFFPQKNMKQRAPKLKWVQLLSAGADYLTNSEIWRSKIIITGASGIHATPISEYVLGTMLMFVKNTPQSFRLKQTHEWKKYITQPLHGKTIGILGLGHIGREIARLAKSFGMRILAIDEIKGTRPARNVDKMIPVNQLNRLLEDSDFVVSCLPLTPKTRNMIGGKELRAMKSTAYLINISRGAIVDEDALVYALKNRVIAGAALDVTVTEPLPPDSPLWDLENIYLTPHVSGIQDDYHELATALFRENLKRYLKGKKLMNVISRKRGY